MTSRELRLFFDEGRSILVGSVDAEGEPSCCRGVALTANDDISVATIYVPVDTAQQTIANVATTRRVAVTTSQPLDHRTIQIKGWCQSVRLAREDERDLVLKRMEQFTSILEEVGIPRQLSARMNHWPVFAIEISVEAVFDQTPGPRAGASI